MELTALADRAHTAILVVECQEGVIGGSVPGPLRGLGDVVRNSQMLPKLAKLLAVARAARIPIMYCTVELRADGLGMAVNTPLVEAIQRGEPRMVKGTSDVTVVPEISPGASDFVVARIHGMTPFHDTELGSLLSNMNIRTVVPTGVSLNVAIAGATFEAVNRGFRVLIPADCVAGFPADYAEAMLRNTLRPVAYLTNSGELTKIWEAS